MKKDYVCGFVFSLDKKRVVLIEKTHPEWMKGKLNGVGGAVNAGKELPIEAMVREFEEEAGVRTAPRDWRHFCTITSDKAHVFFYVAFLDIEPKSMTEEPVQWCDLEMEVDYVFDKVVDNITWLFPLAFDEFTPFAMVTQ